LISENENKPSVFSEWEECDCNQCEHYWDSSCDGVAKDKRKVCGQFSATRSVIIPEQIKDLYRLVKWVMWSEILIAVGVIIHVIGACLR
jgi:hypothetical protein